MGWRHSWPWKVGLVGAALIASACGADEGAGSSGSPEEGGNGSKAGAEAPSEVATIAVKGDEYKFDAPKTVPSGKVAFEFENTGEEKHEMVVFMIKDDSKLQDLLAMPQKEAQKHVAIVGGAGAKPGETAGKPLQKNLSPGRYAMVCFLPAPDKTPHFVKGMLHEFSVE